MSKAFAITDSKGVRFTFPNGFGISIQWGPGNYADNYDSYDYEAPKKASWYASDQAEIAIIHPNKKLMPLGFDSVEGYCSIDKVFEWVDKVRALAPSTPFNHFDKREGGDE